MKDFTFSEAAQFIGAAIKEKHTVIQKWPFRLKLPLGQPGAQGEFDRLLGWGVLGEERYVEWRGFGRDHTGVFIQINLSLHLKIPAIFQVFF
jgi:hypothetical protein